MFDGSSLFAAEKTQQSAVGATHQSRLTQDRIESFLHNLPGFWDGRAVETPVGPTDYDIHFHSCDDGNIAGVANTGASLHHWRFTGQHGRLRIHFLSTFGGNRTPIKLITELAGDSELMFFAPAREMLTLSILPAQDRIDIRVFHHGDPHVHIRLKRSKITPAETQPHHGRMISCQGAPTR